jgi:glucose dehydrogenase
LASGSLSPAAARSAPFRLAALDDFAPGSSKPPDVETKGRFPASVRPMALPSGQNRRARTSPMTMALESPKPEEAWQLYVRALDATTGKKIWDYQQVSSFHYGPGVLSTAGGLVFAGEHKGQVSALDARTGRSLWHFNTGDLITSSPISYAIDGQQYIAISSGTNVFAFALP